MRFLIMLLGLEAEFGRWGMSEIKILNALACKEKRRKTRAPGWFGDSYFDPRLLIYTQFRFIFGNLRARLLRLPSADTSQLRFDQIRIEKISKSCTRWRIRLMSFRIPSWRSDESFASSRDELRARRERSEICDLFTCGPHHLAQYLFRRFSLKNVFMYISFSLRRRFSSRAFFILVGFMQNSLGAAKAEWNFDLPRAY